MPLPLERIPVVAKASVALTSLSEGQRAKAFARFEILLLDEEGKPAKPYLTVIEDDYSRAIAGYRLSFQEATALITALTLGTAASS